MSESLSRPKRYARRAFAPRDQQHFDGLRNQAPRPGRAIDGGAAFTPVRDNVLLALLDAVEAASQAAILSYDPSKTDAQNDEYQRRARRLNEALNVLGIGPS